MVSVSPTNIFRFSGTILNGSLWIMFIVVRAKISGREGAVDSRGSLPIGSVVYPNVCFSTGSFVNL